VDQFRGTRSVISFTDIHLERPRGLPGVRATSRQQPHARRRHHAARDCLRHEHRRQDPLQPYDQPVPCIAAEHPSMPSSRAVRARGSFCQRKAPPRGWLAPASHAPLGSPRRDIMSSLLARDDPLRADAAPSRSPVSNGPVPYHEGPHALGSSALATRRSSRVQGRVPFRHLSRLVRGSQPAPALGARRVSDSTPTLQSMRPLPALCCGDDARQGAAA